MTNQQATINYSDAYAPTPWWIYGQDEWKEDKFETLAQAQAEWPEAQLGVSAKVAIKQGKR